MVLNYNNAPFRMLEIWDWVVAFDAFDFGDRQPLTELLQTSNEVPVEAARQLAKIVSGQRSPNLKAAAKLKIPAAERMRIAGSISAILGLVDAGRRSLLPDGLGGRASATQVIADQEGREHVEITRELNGMLHGQIAAAAIEINVSVETVENLIRDLRKKIASFPEF